MLLNMQLGAIIILFVAIWVLAFYRAAPQVWLPIVALLLLIDTYFSWIFLPILIVFWLIWIAFAWVIINAPWRRKFIMQIFLKWFKKQQPTLTDEEQQVLEAGGLWWEKQFFLGNPDWRQLFVPGKPVLTAEEQSFLDNQVETLCRMVDEWKIEIEEKNIPEEIWTYIKKERFWGLIIDKQFGGHQFSAIAHSAIITKVASRNYSIAVTVMVPNALGPAEFLKHYGTSQQQEYYLPRLVHGEEVPCFALTAANTGSDAVAMTDYGVVCEGIYEGKKILGMRLNWKKRYITLAPITTLIGLAFHLSDPDHLLGEQENIGITIALIPAHLPGVEIGKHHSPLNIALLNGPVSGKDVFVPLDCIIGGVERRGQGWQMMMECLSIGRGISLPALSAANTQLCYRMTSAYALIREQFHRSIGDFEGVKKILARIGGFTYLCEATRIFTAQAVENGVRPAIASAIAKYHLTEMSRIVINDAMDIHAGRGIQMGKRNYLASKYISAPISITVEGANILTRNLIIFGQGVMRCHPYLRGEIIASMHPNEIMRVRKFDRLIRKHIGSVINLIARVSIYGLTGGHFIRSPKKDATAKYFRQLTRMSHAFMLVTDLSLVVIGGRLKLKESLSARLADVLSHLYMASAVLKYYAEQGAEQGEAQDFIFVEWCVSYCLQQIYQAIIDFLANFPVRWLAKLLRGLIFPWGQSYCGPKDAVSFAIAAQMQKDLLLADRLSPYTFVSKNPQDSTGRMEMVWRNLLAAKPLFEKIETAIAEKRISRQDRLAETIEIAYNAKILSALERDQLLQVEMQRWDAVQVDEF